MALLALRVVQHSEDRKHGHFARRHSFSYNAKKGSSK
jgi:hypothetical protein